MPCWYGHRLFGFPLQLAKHHAMQCNAMHAMHAMQCNTMQCNAMQCMQCNAMQKEQVIFAFVLKE